MLRLQIPWTWVAATGPTRHPSILPNLSKEPDGVILIWEFECDLYRFDIPFKTFFMNHGGTVRQHVTTTLVSL
jgi:hypothetical protein